jgi:glutamine amidotransferase
MVVIVDYGMGNIHSLRRIFTSLKLPVVVSHKVKDIEDASHIILPGVGHFGRAMDELKQRGLINTLNQAAMGDKKPILGICLGMQLMTASSEEGNSEGLAWFPCKTTKIMVEDPIQFKVPHLGWNTLHTTKAHPILQGVPSQSEMYFAHAYAVDKADEEQVLCTTTYEKVFVSGLISENIIGLQFHPEKSHAIGQRILANFTQSCIVQD